MSETLSTMRRNSLAAEDAVFFHSDLSLNVAASMWIGSEIAGLPASLIRDGY